MDEELLEKFVIWYWKEIQGKPYQIRAEEVVKYFIEDQKK